MTDNFKVKDTLNLHIPKNGSHNLTIHQNVPELLVRALARQLAEFDTKANIEFYSKSANDER